MRFLHLADVHLDTPFASRSRRLRRRLREACREAFRRAVDVALNRELDAVLVAGDLFDGALLSLQTEGFLVDQLRRLADGGVPVVYATGNHDPGVEAAASVPWPSNVTVVASPEPRRIPVPRRGGKGVAGWVTAAGHDAPRVTRDLAAAFPRPSGPEPEVALLHARVGGARDGDAHHPYAPTTLSTLRGAGYDYWALGHVHRRQRLSDDPPVHYPGNLQGRTPAETGPRGGLLVELGGAGGAAVSFQRLAPVRWERVVVDDLQEVEGHHRLVSSVRAALDERRSRDDGDREGEWVVVVELRGPSPLWRRFREEDDLEELEEDLASRLGVLAVELRVGRLHPPIRPRDHRERQDVLGEALRLVAEVRSGESELPPGVEPGALGGFDPGGEEPLSEYVAALLEDGEEELLPRFLRRFREGGS